jgi:peptide-methionine (R)-S-oxide reductase
MSEHNHRQAPSKSTAPSACGLPSGASIHPSIHPSISIHPQAFPHQRSDAEWRSQLSELQYHVTRQQGTEPLFANAYYAHKAVGQDHCICCDRPLFSSAHKFDSGTGWPSFYAPIDTECVATTEDSSHGMRRIEVHCSQCGGHVFEDGPAPTGLRYCINSAALDFTAQAPGS